MGFNEYGYDEHGEPFLTVERVWRHWLSRRQIGLPMPLNYSMVVSTPGKGG
jgi:hypothetical protein